VTFGIGCTGLPGWYYHAAALCKNGDATSGPTYYGTSGTKSYAYCSSVGSTINYADPGFAGPNCSVGCIRGKQGQRIFIDSPLNVIRHRYLAGLPRAAATHRAIHPVRTMAPRPSASVNGNCSVWSDNITFGIGCTGLPGWYYDGNANCRSGNTAYGPGEYGTSGTKSYAYCSTYHSFVLSAWADFYR
jgi:hypothetical protein